MAFPFSEGLYVSSFWAVNGIQDTRGYEWESRKESLSHTGIFKTKSHTEKIKQILLRIEAAMSSQNDQRPVAIGVFLLLLAYFEEDHELMLRSDVDVSFKCKPNWLIGSTNH